jgi:hypothetical protein
MEASMYEKLDTVKEPAEEVTLELLNVRVESFAEGLNKFYDQTRKEISGAFMFAEHREKQKDLVMSQTMQMIQASLTGFTAQFEVVLNEITGGDKSKQSDMLKAATARAEELIKLQQEEVQRIIQEQQEAAAKAQAAGVSESAKSAFTEM